MKEEMLQSEVGKISSFWFPVACEIARWKREWKTAIRKTSFLEIVLTNST